MKHIQKYIAEGIGTFVLVFCGTGAIVVNDVSDGMIGHVGISMTFGLAVLCMVYAIGSLSGAHINPAVTIALWFSRHIKTNRVAPYIFSQILGAILASFLLQRLFPEATTLGETIPSGSICQSLILEAFLTFILVFVIIQVAIEWDNTKKMAGVAIGGMVALGALFGGPISGASMNPARSLGPAIVASNYADVWIYIVGPVFGGILAVAACKMLGKQRIS